MQSSLFDPESADPPPPEPVDAAVAELGASRTAPVSARRSDPVSSHITVQSLAKDGSMAALIMRTIMFQSMQAGPHLEDGMDFRHPVCDDAVWMRLEDVTGRRWQRNVIARTRGLMERDDWVERVPDIEGPRGRPVIAYVPTQKAIEWWQKERQ